ncbi:unnamed protein product [Paramecium pentaurelia]|uniref:RNA helicase n=1 Tax=Paramecium pentaurelia TaxID=43138 RepID=A0A8S1U115_9CILI|nr:unnamed protein product [Paramecium pentaurelia]
MERESRSRDDSKGRQAPFYRESLYRSSSSVSSQFKVPSGPMLFKGTENSSVQKNAQPQFEEDADGFKKPPARSEKLEEERKRNKLLNEYTAFEWENIEQESDRKWYDYDEDDIGNASQQDWGGEVFKGQKEEFKFEEYSKRKGQTVRQSEKNQEQNRWELNRMIASDVFKRKADAWDFYEEENEKRVVIHVHDIKPPFLDGKVVYTTQLTQVQIVKDPNSDMAKLAKQGSEVLMLMREKQDKTKMRERFWELSGSKMGKVMNLDRKKEQDPDRHLLNEDGDYDFKASSRYQTALQRVTQGQSDFARNKTIKEQREYLPVFHCRSELVQLLHDNRVSIIVGETGSGKTTQLTQYLYEEGYTNTGVIGCTQPRRVAAVSVAKRVAEEMGVELGSKVGYAIRFEDYTSKDTVIKYMTDGVLLRESLQDPDLEKYSAVIMDEAHERSLNTDVLFGILKKVAQRRRDIRIIITSATMNAKKFSDFFGGVPIYKIPGRTFPVDVRFEKAPAQDYVRSAIKKTIEVHIQQPPGDVLIFMTGQEDIETTCYLLAEELNKLSEATPPLLILPIYSQLRSEEQARIFEKSEFRKCIVATNIAETSLTLDGVKYVIDTGYCKMKVYNPRIGMDALQVTPISQANADQRKGRAGRTGPGICFRLYSSLNYRQDMLENNIPEIQRTNLANVVLLLKSLNINNLLDFDFMDPPPQDTILNAMYQLWVLGALDNVGELTELGRKMSEFPLDPPLSKMLIKGDQLGCTEEILTVVSMLSVPGIFYRPKDREAESDAAREKLFVGESDHLTMLNVFEQWKRHEFSPEWCNDHFVQAKSMRKVREVRAQLKDIAGKLGLKMSTCNFSYDVVRKAICSAYFQNAAKIKGVGDYINLRTGMPCKLHPSSALYSLGYAPDYVVYHELVMTSKEYMHCVSAVDPQWLAEMGPMFFSIKEDGETRASRIESEKKSKREIELSIEKAKREHEMKSEECLRRREKEDRERRLISERTATLGFRPSRIQTPLRQQISSIAATPLRSECESVISGMTSIQAKQMRMAYYDDEEEQNVGKNKIPKLE